MIRHTSLQTKSRLLTRWPTFNLRPRLGHSHRIRGQFITWMFSTYLSVAFTFSVILIKEEKYLQRELEPALNYWRPQHWRFYRHLPKRRLISSLSLLNGAWAESLFSRNISCRHLSLSCKIRSISVHNFTIFFKARWNFSSGFVGLTMSCVANWPSRPRAVGIRKQ